MSAVGMTPSFGQLTTSYARGPQATRQFQNAEFNFISSTNTPSASNSPNLSADVASDYNDIRQMQGNQGGNKSLYGKVVDFFVGQKISNAMKA